MDLWVRSISKRILLKVDNILVVEAENKHCLYTLSHDEEIELGEYETKERALEVLDEIQKLLINDLLLLRNFDIGNGKKLSDFIKPSKALCLSDRTDKPQVEVLHHNCIVYEIPEK